MSQNTDHYQLITPPSSLSSSSNQNNKRLPTHQQFLSSSSDFNTPTCTTIQNDSSSPQSYTSPIVSDVCAGNQNGVRNASTTMKINNINSPNGNHFNDKYAFTLEFAPPVVKTKKDHNRNLQTQLFPTNMAANDDEDLHSPFELDVPLCENQSLKKIQNDFLIDRMLKDDINSNFTSQQRSPNQSSYTNVLNHASPLLTPSSDHHDIDALSDAGTYIIDDDIDIARDDEPEQDIEQQNDIQEQNSTSIPASFKRYATTKRNRHGTFEIHPITSSSITTTGTHTVNRPVVDLNIPTHDLSSPSSSSSANLSSSSSLLSLPTESDNSIRKEPEGASHYIIDDNSSTGLVYARQRPNSLSQQRSITPPQNQIKPAECFVISPTFETKPFPNIGLRRKTDAQWKPKLTTSVVPTKDTNIEISSKKSPPSPPLSTRSNQSEQEGFSFRLQRKQQQQQQQQPPPPRHHDSKQPSSSTDKSSLHNSDYTSTLSKSSLRPHTTITDQTYSSPFQRNSSIRQTMPANSQYNRRTSSSSTTNKYLDDNEEVLSTHPSLTKVYMNKSFALRRQRSNLVPSTSKPIQQQQQQQTQQTVSKPLATRQLSKPITSIPSTSLSTNNATGQTNRAVELRRARAQAKIEELAQRTRHQLQKTEQRNDIMSASWHSNASSSSKKDFSHLKSNPRSNNNNNNNLASQRQDLLKTRTIVPPSSSSHHRSSSASPNPLGETTTKTLKYRKIMTSSVTDESQYHQNMSESTYSEGERCDSLRDDGQRLAIKLIQLSSGILSKLKPTNTINDSDSNVRELEQLVNQLQTVNRTLSNIDASLPVSTSDETIL